MTIRNQNDGLSRVKWHENQYFSLQDKNVTPTDFNRFLYMKPGTKNKFFDWRLDWKNTPIQSTIFLINQEKFVNRPDAISHNVYGNSKYWWIIAMVNEIRDPFVEFTLGRKLKIPDLDLVRREFGM
jgi:hypothetical protein